MQAPSLTSHLSRSGLVVKGVVVDAMHESLDCDKRLSHD
jgi:hypothetical protein